MEIGNDSVCPIFSVLVAIRRPIELVHTIISSFKTRKPTLGCWAKEAKMASSSSIPEKSNHVRSISLPSTSHPITLRVEEEINKLKTWVALSFSSTSSLRMEMIHSGLNGLKNLYDCVEDFLQLQVTQEVITHHRDEKWVDELLDGSVMLLDLCSTANDILVSMEEHMLDLLSTLRRTKGREWGMESKVQAYFCSRKKMKKDISKCLALLKRMDNRHASVPISDQDPDLSMVVRVQGELRMITISFFQAILSFLCFSKPKPKPSKWSLVSTLVRSKRSIAREREQEDMSEVMSFHTALFSLCGKISSKVAEMERVQKAQRQLEALEVGIKDIEAGLDCIFKCLIKTRASLLNILTQ
ncbi:hypothetical protein CKAN_01336900 [Cinnamomum micranthum f. kanehirae]|uniref:DUF241 domain-containing protein n=1 Tax=Cinnamomum micranthum f. kanehirae TaxID=337451 RepID=A0A3S3P740_9MAGN|nr:hypothetical protein CKAN_01336900 [Cinnamomum micranthum f. kanehirae]